MALSSTAKATPTLTHKIYLYATEYNCSIATNWLTSLSELGVHLLLGTIQSSGSHFLWLELVELKRLPLQPARSYPLGSPAVRTPYLQGADRQKLETGLFSVNVRCLQNVLLSSASAGRYTDT